MKAILMSIHPEWCEKIFSGEKTIEVRKAAPKEVPFKVYIYMTATKERCRFWEYITAYQNNKGDILNGSQKVIGEFICDKVDCYPYGDMSFPIPAYEGDPTVCECGKGYFITCGELEKTCLEYKDLETYGKGKLLSGLHISDLKIYDKPKELSEFYKRDKTYDNAFAWAFEDRQKNIPLTHPPQSWQYVEEL